MAVMLDRERAEDPETSDGVPGRSGTQVSKARKLRQRAARGALSAHDQLELEHYRESFDVLAALTPEDALVRRLGRELEALGTMPDGKGTG